jgi:response regulator RpfG family c-di-GMP phosphodiesterase
MNEGGRAGAPVVLLVDDEPQVLASLADLLRKECRVLSTTDPAEALRILETRDVALLLSDQRMPEMSGTEVLARAAALSPTTVRVLITGYTDIEAVIDAINQSRVFSYIAKPWDPDALLAVVREATELHGLASEERRLLSELQRIVSEGQTEPLDPAATAVRGLGREVQILGRSVARLEEVFEHLHRIGDVVPVCMSCGRFKTGEARWEAAMEYLKKHSRNLSHGYCPECAEKVRAAWKLKP